MSAQPNANKNAFSERWTNHLRQQARQPSLSCPYCRDRPTQKSKAALLKHVEQMHPEMVPQKEDVAEFENFQKQLVLSAGGSKIVEKDSLANRPQNRPRSNERPTATTSSSPVASVEKDFNRHNIIYDDHPNKRAAIGQGRAPSSTASIKSGDSHQGEHPRRSKNKSSRGNVGLSSSLASPAPSSSGELPRPPPSGRTLYDHTRDASTPKESRLNQRNAMADSRVSPRARTISNSIQGQTNNISSSSHRGTFPSSFVNNSTSPAAWSSDRSGMASQPATRPISKEQLVAEVKGIYAGLVMVEGKCIQVDLKQNQLAREAPPGTKLRLSHDQWQALIALHRTLLHEHHDFFLASQHPSTTPIVKNLAEKYAMPARLWKHGIHSFLELLRSRLPESLEHMLAFIYLAYNMLTLLYETVPRFEKTWIECLGDLGRYRMAIEDNNPRDIEVWTQVSRQWYLKVANESPGIGRLYHHLGILARPDTLSQLLYFGKALTVESPFTAARESVMTIFEPALHDKSTRRHLSPAIKLYVKAQAILFTKSSLTQLDDVLTKLMPELGSHIGKVTTSFKEQGYCIGIANCNAMHGLNSSDMLHSWRTQEGVDDGSGSSPDQIVFSGAQRLGKEILAVALARVGDANVLSIIHVMLCFTKYVAQSPGAMERLALDFPFGQLVIMLNFIIIEYVRQDLHAGMAKFFALIQEKDFPWNRDLDPKPLPEDWAMQGLPYTKDYWPEGWFSDKIEAEEHYLENDNDSITKLDRPERICWLGYQISKTTGGRWFAFDESTNRFCLPGEALSTALAYEQYDTPMSIISSPNDTSTGSSNTVAADSETEDFLSPSRMSTMSNNGGFADADMESIFDKTDRVTTWNTNLTEDGGPIDMVDDCLTPVAESPPDEAATPAA